MGRLRGIFLLFLAVARCAEGKKVAVKEVVLDSAVRDMQWLGEDDKVVLVQTMNGRLYRSTNGGEKWNEISDQLMMEPTIGKGAAALKRPITVNRMQKSKADPSTIIVIGKDKTHYISATRGETWRKLKHSGSIHTFLFHKTRPKWALLSTWTPACSSPKARRTKKDAAAAEGEAAGDDWRDDSLPCSHQLYVTKDLGRTFQLVVDYVVQFSWGHTAINQQDRIYFTDFRKKEGDQDKLYIWSPMVDFAQSDDCGRRVVRTVTHGNKFLISNNFIFVAKLKDANTQTVSMMVSTDGGKQFRTAVLPQDLEEKSYTVLDTSEGAVMIHVNHGSTEPPFNVGNVYVSDGEGIRFTLSLANNVRSSGGDCEFDKVLCLEGVYLANFRDTAEGNDDEADEVRSEKEDKEKDAEELEQEGTEGTQVDKTHSVAAKSKDESVVRTVISFDKGGGWTYLKPPKVDSLGKKIDCVEGKCWLHLHGITNFQNYAPFYSIENAIGIIMGTGNVGPYLRTETDLTNTYLSRDGGLTWVESHKGAFIYEFGDHGGLLVMADDIRKTKQIVFSWNEGNSWYDFELSEFPVDVDNIVTEPNATATKFLCYGTRGNSGVMYHLDFEALGQPLCKGVWAADSASSDYETWSPSDGKNTEKCMLGRQVTYTRRKPASECFNGEKFERPTQAKNCECTAEDFQCEMGFTRKIDSTDCKYADDGLIKMSEEKCASADSFSMNAYRKVVGDLCESGWQPKQAQVPCPRNAKLSRGAMSVLGTFVILIFAMGGVTFLSRSETFKHMFANYGFDAYGDVKYATIGGKIPETAIDSVGTRFDADFIEEENEFDNLDAPQLMSYTGGRGGNERDRDRDRDDRRDRRDDIPRRIDTAAASVPQLAKPGASVPKLARPPAAAEEEDPLDLL